MSLIGAKHSIALIVCGTTSSLGESIEDCGMGSDTEAASEGMALPVAVPVVGYVQPAVTSTPAPTGTTQHTRVCSEICDASLHASS